jgi:hypothetical protein
LVESYESIKKSNQDDEDDEDDWVYMHIYCLLQNIFIIY